jgi:Zn finger protein HypA/HybF involved in hydrogenase expression
MNMNKSMLKNGVEETDAALAVIPLERAWVCINCERVFTILPGQITCPKCMSQQWRPVGAWLCPSTLSLTGGAL